MIKWITRPVAEAIQWQHEDDIPCVAFQNRVAHAMGGNTLHSGGDSGVGGQRSLEHTDIDVLFTQNQYLRWVIIDELPMVPDDLLGAFASHLADAASPSRYHKKLTVQCGASAVTTSSLSATSTRSRPYLALPPSPSLLSIGRQREQSRLWTSFRETGRIL